MKIVFLDSATLSIGDIDFQSLNSIGEVTFFERTPDQLVVERSKNAEVIITNKVKITNSHLDGLPNLKYICVSATGYNNVDLEAAQRHSIPVSNVSGYSTSGVVQHVFAAILNVLNRVESYSQQVRQGRWQTSPDFTFYDHSIRELAGLTLGVFGFGSIGQKVAAVAHAFGMKIVATHRHPERDKVNYVKFVELEELFVASDIVTLHAPLNASTSGIINYELLSTMKPSAILINTARGPIINELDLAKALQEHKLAFACLDVLTNEPPEEDNPLIKIPNCIITPHQAWASQQSRQRLLDGLVANIQSFVDGDIQNRVG